MSTSNQASNPIVLPVFNDLAQVRTAILLDPGIPDLKKRDIASALCTFSKALQRPIESLPADPVRLRGLLADMSAARAGLTEGRWRNVRSLLQFALGRCGITVVSGRAQNELSAAWRDLLVMLVEMHDRHRLGRLGRYCSMRGIAPEAVNDRIMTAFLADLRDRSLVSEPERLHRDICVSWNRWAQTFARWPQNRLQVPDNRDVYSIPWDSFPPSLLTEIDAWRNYLSGKDFDAERNFRPLRATSINTNHKHLGLFLSALVHRGCDPARLLTLADVVQPDQVKLGLEFFWDRRGGKPSVGASKVVSVLRSIAKHWVELPSDQLATLASYERQMKPEAHGMTKRNRERLHQFEDPARLQAVLALPVGIAGDVRGARAPNCALALQMQDAIAVEILTMVPLRISNLASLRIGSSLLRDSRGGWRIVLEEEEVKNRMLIDVKVPTSTAELLDLYVDRYRPLLTEGGAWLFPGRGDRPKTTGGLRERLKQCLLERCGVVMHPHLFRHLAGMIMLNHNPGSHGQVQRVLGHKKIDTTLQFYSGMEGRAAINAYGSLVETLRTPAIDVPSRAHAGSAGR